MLDELLNNINSITGSALPSRNVYESILGEYLHFIGLDEGALMLHVFGHPLALAGHTGDQFVEPYEWWLYHPHASSAHLAENRYTHILDDVGISWLDEHGATRWQRDPEQTVLLIPLVTEDEILGAIVIVPPLGYCVPYADVEAGEIIAAKVSKYLKEKRLQSLDQRASAIAQKVARLTEAIRVLPISVQLLNESLRLIRDEFCFYMVGFYRVDHDRGWAFLQSATGNIGRNMIARAHPLLLTDEDTLAGWVVKHHKPRIALDVGESATQFADPLIPNTRSEIMLPIGKEHPVGILDILSFEPTAFLEEDIPLFQALGDELMTALQKTQGTMS